jgi:plasmid replication initiation protein
MLLNQENCESSLDESGQPILFNDDFPVAKINGDMLVVKETSLARGALDLSTPEHRLVSAIASLISPNDLPGKKYYFELKDYCKFFGLDEDGNHTQMRKTFAKLRSRTFEIKRKNEIHITGWINHAKIIKNTGIVEIDIDSNILPFLLHIQDNQSLPRIGIDTSIGFIKYPLESVRTFATSYTFNLYDFFKTILRDQKKISYYISLEELRKIMTVKSGEYELYGGFKRRALLPAIAEINGDIKLYEKLGRKLNSRLKFSPTDIHVEFTEREAKQKKVEGISFHLTKVETILPTPAEPLSQDDSDDRAEALLALIDIGLGKIKAHRLIKEYEPDRIIKNIDYAKKEYEERHNTSSPIRSLKGYVVYCIENDSAQPSNYELEQERLKVEKQLQLDQWEQYEKAKEDAAAAAFNEIDQIIENYIKSLSPQQLEMEIQNCREYLINSNREEFANGLTMESIKDKLLMMGMFKGYIRDEVLKLPITA